MTRDSVSASRPGLTTEAGSRSGRPLKPVKIKTGNADVLQAATLPRSVKAHVAARKLPVTASGTGEVRIIGGRWKRTRLPVAALEGLRPTPDRVRETLFNWLGQDLSGWRCLDAFAGTGALGLEAASRGAAAVQLVESHPALVAQLHTVHQQLQASAVRVQRGDGISALQSSAPASLDLVLLDPPFDSSLFLPALRAALRPVKASGYVYLEAPNAWSAEALAEQGYALYRYLRAGAVHAHLLQKT